MKRNSDSSTSSNPRNLSAFIAQVVKDSPNQEKDVLSHKRYKTAPQPSVEGRGASFKMERKKIGNTNNKQIKQQIKNNQLTRTIMNSKFFDKVSPQSKPQCKQEVEDFETPDEPGITTPQDSTNPQCNLTPNKLTIPPHTTFQSETSRKSLSEYIGKVTERSPTCSLQAGKDSVGAWIKTAVKALSPTALTEGCTPREKKRKRKLVSEGFAEYIKILSPRLANDVHMWYHSVKQDTHLEGVDSREIITACVLSIHLQGLLYNSVCVAVDPVPDNIFANEQFKTDSRLTIVFTHQTVEMLRIKPNSCVKICPPWTLLSVGDLGYPVILCTYFSFLTDPLLKHSKQLIPPVSLPCQGISAWRSTQSLDIIPRGSNSVVTEECVSDSELRVCQYQLTAGLKSQRWEDLSLAGTVAHVSHSVNPRDLSDSQVTEMNLDQHFHTFLRDFSGTYCLVTLPTPILDKHTSVQQPYQLINSTVFLKSVKLVSRVNILTSPRVMSTIQSLSNRTQKCCYCLSGSLNTKLEILKGSPVPETLGTIAGLSVFTSQTDLSGEPNRLSLVGRLLHIQMETQSVPEGNSDEHSRSLSGCYIFLFGSNSVLFQVYLEPVLSRGLSQCLKESTGKLLFLGSLYVSSITHRPTRLHGDQYSLLLELENAGLLLGKKCVGKLRDEFRSVSPSSYPIFGYGYQLWSMVCVRGSIVDVVEDSAYVWQVCGRCGEGVEEFSQSNEFYCDECQTSVTDPVDRYNLDLIIECEGVRGTELIVHLHDDTVKSILPFVGEGKVYDKLELRGREIEMKSCFVREKLALPCGLTKVYLEESKHSLTFDTVNI